MIKKLVVTVTIVIGLIFSACANKKPFQESKVVSQAALVYVYAAEDSNVDDTHLIASYSVGINGYVTDKSLYAGEYIKLDVKPGPISISTARKDLEIKTIKLDVQAGETYYLRLQSYSSSFGKFTFKQVDHGTARAEIAKTVSSSEFMIKGNIIDALIDPNTNQNNSNNVAGMSEADINAIIEKKLSAMKTVSAPAQTAPAQISTPTYSITKKVSKMDEIQRAFDMMQSGMLTREEFNTIKAEILAK